uniref:Uncharacterized protein n=1 Tax=Arundo donax TaxID=35708 RepID=A0A0A9DIH5_ARUDO
MYCVLFILDVKKQNRQESILHCSSCANSTACLFQISISKMNLNTNFCRLTQLCVHTIFYEFF